MNQLFCAKISVTGILAQNFFIIYHKAANLT